MSKKRILIVDDAHFMRNLLRRALEEAGYEIAGEARDGKEGIIKYFELKPDIVTMDINMPEMTGTQTIREILSKDKDAKIIAVSGVSDESVIRETFSAGAKAYLQKPFQPAPLWDKVEAVLKGEICGFEFGSKEVVAPVVIDDDMEIEVLTESEARKSPPIIVKNEMTKIEIPDDFEDDSKSYILTEDIKDEEGLNLEYEASHEEIREEEERMELETPPPREAFDKMPPRIRPPKVDIYKNDDTYKKKEEIEEPILNEVEEEQDSKGKGFMSGLMSLFGIKK